MVSRKSVLKISLVVLGVFIIMYIGSIARLSSINTETVLDYDPWWYFRKAELIVNNNFMPPQWDIQSFYPPGRPGEPLLGWPYTIIFFWMMLAPLGYDLMKAAILSPVIMTALAAIPAFFLGKRISNSVGGLATAFFALLAPTFITISFAGYSDSDAAVVFWFFVSLLSIFVAIDKKHWLYYIPALVANLAFAWNWSGGWTPLILLLAYIPAFFIFRVIEKMAQERKLSIKVGDVIREEKKGFLKPVVVLIVLASIIGFGLGLGSVFHNLAGGIGFTGLLGESPLLVNRSVAELQLLNVFSVEGFQTVAARVGLLPVILTFFALPLFILYKFWKKEKAKWFEVFLFMWAFIMFYLITRGIRFSLLFSIAASVASGYVIGNLYSRLRRYVLPFSIVFGCIALLSLMFLSTGVQFGFTSSGYEISSNWYEMLDWLKANADENALVATWWDPGHILAGYTGLRVHADGAHCSPGDCIPYNHNTRIQDMGKIMTTNSEQEAVDILSKYRELTPDQCERVRIQFGDIVPEDACDAVSEMYVIASADLISKYYWMSYFGSWDGQNGDGRNFLQLPLSGQTEDSLQYSNGLVELVARNNGIVPVINTDRGAAVVSDLVFFQDEQQRLVRNENATNVLEGMVWVDPSFQAVIFMDSSIRDSMFTRLFFFNGEGLEHFELVLSNPEIKLYRVNF